MASSGGEGAGARAAALFFRGPFRGVVRAPPTAKCSFIPWRAPVGALRSVASESGGRPGPTWRGSGARIQTTSRSWRRDHCLLRAKFALDRPGPGVNFSFTAQVRFSLALTGESELARGRRAKVGTQRRSLKELAGTGHHTTRKGNWLAEKLG